MNVTISAPVGYHGKAGGNRAPDVRAIHDLLSRVPPGKGGPGAALDPKASYSAKTDQVIYNFQKFHSFEVADATVHPGHETLALLNRLADSGVRPGSQPILPQPATTPTPPASPHVEPLKVLAVMTSTIVGHGYVKGFDGETKMGLGRFRVPLYRLKLGMADASGTSWKLSQPIRDFDVVRFGVYIDSAAYRADPNYKHFRMQGPPLGEFSLARDTYMSGSWLIQGNYYIHDGPDSPHFKSDDDQLRRLVGALGCIELCWVGGMRRFDEAVRTLSFGDFYGIGFYEPKEADERITKSQSFRCIVEPALTPPLLPLTDFRPIGGPAPISG